MAEIAANESHWGQAYEWPQQGDEWSEPWGGPRNQWWGTLYPRIHPFMPTDTILEIAPGFGRWTQFLQPRCKRLIVVDLNENCIESCKRRFADCDNIEYHKNDGRSLEMVHDGSVDLIFSFDSLVHADPSVIQAYVLQFAEKLTRHGVGFIHHSNVGSYLRPLRRLPRSISRHLDWRLNKRVNRHWRSMEMSAEKFRGFCEEAGLSCIAQECVNWRGDYLIDCMSTFTRPGSVWDRPLQVVKNPQFMEEAARLKLITPSAKSQEA
jgi:hypothetical protein